MDYALCTSNLEVGVSRRSGDSRAFAWFSARQRTLLVGVGTERAPYKSAATESASALGTIKSSVSRARRRCAEYTA